MRLTWVNMGDYIKVISVSHDGNVELFQYCQEKKRKEKKKKEKKSACSGWWPERPWGMITVFSSQLSPVLHFPPHRPGAQDKSQQAQMLATCQMLLGLRLPALSIWLATLAVSHLLLNQHFLVNNLIGREITITFFIFVDSNIISLIRMSVSHE